MSMEGYDYYQNPTQSSSIPSTPTSYGGSPYDMFLILPIKSAFQLVDVIMDALTREFGPKSSMFSQDRRSKEYHSDDKSIHSSSHDSEEHHRRASRRNFGGKHRANSFHPLGMMNDLSPYVSRLCSELMNCHYLVNYPTPILISELDEEEFAEKLVDCLGNLLNGSEDWEDGVMQQRGTPDNPIKQRILEHEKGFEVFKSLANGSIFRRMQQRKHHHHHQNNNVNGGGGNNSSSKSGGNGSSGDDRVFNWNMMFSSSEPSKKKNKTKKRKSRSGKKGSSSRQKNNNKEEDNNNKRGTAMRKHSSYSNRSVDTMSKIEEEDNDDSSSSDEDDNLV